MEIILKLLPYILCAVIPSFFFIRNNINRARDHETEIEEKNKITQSLRDQIVDMALTEGKKTEIRNKQNEKENDIIADPGADHGVMPVSTGKAKHNHARRDTCGKDCPAYH